MKNINDLLQEISSSKLAKKSDNVLMGWDNQTTYSYDKIYAIWKDYHDNGMGCRRLEEKYGLKWNTLKKKFLLYNLGLVDVKTDWGKHKILKNPRMKEIMDGMSYKEWTQKYGKGYYHYKKRLQRYNLI